MRKWLAARRSITKMRRVGDHGESVAARYLRKQGVEVLARNVRRARGEIDLVVRDGETIVFVEVKSRVTREGDEWTGLERIDRTKRDALRRACNACRRSLPDAIESYRVDAVAVEFRPGRYWGRRVEDVRWYPAILDLEE
jgi:putative endonuclease